MYLVLDIASITRYDGIMMTNELSTMPAEQTFYNVTFYRRGEMMGTINRVDAKTLTVSIKPYAQYPHAIHLTWKSKGQRNERGSVVCGYKPFFALVDTKAAIQPDGLYDPSTSVTSGGCTVTKGRYSSCDPRWVSDFVAQLAAANVTPIIYVNQEN